MHVSFEVLKAVPVKNIAVWDVAPCNQVEIYRRFGRSADTLSTLKTERECSSEEFVNVYQTARRHILEDIII
jgi:hypothetical protein